VARLCVPAPLCLCGPTSTHTTIIPAFYSASSAISLDPLHLSRPLTCLTSPLLSPPLHIVKYPSSLSQLPLASPACGIWLGRRQNKHQLACQPSSRSTGAKPKPETSLLSLRWEQSFRSLSSSQLQICTKPVRSWYDYFETFSSSFSLKFILNIQQAQEPLGDLEARQKEGRHAACLQKNEVKPLRYPSRHGIASSLHSLPRVAASPATQVLTPLGQSLLSRCPCTPVTALLCP